MALKMPVVKPNKGLILTGSGLVIITGVGISELSSPSGALQSVESKEYIDLRTNLKDASPHIFREEFIFPLNHQDKNSYEINVRKNNSNIRTPKLQKSTQVVAQDPNIVTDPNAEVSYSDYTIDAGYLNSLWSTSMGGKFRNHVILAPKNSKIGEQKAEQLKKRAMEANSRKNFFVVNNKDIYDAGNKRLWNISKINGAQMHELCTDILSYNDGGIGFSHISILNQKWFFDFVWENCGRGDRNKPSSGKFA